MVKLMGVVNVTPDSFSDGGEFFDPADALQQTSDLFYEGADIVDLGAESTRPGSEPLSWEQEWQRLEPVFRELAASTIPISLDSYHPETVRAAHATLGRPYYINDITGFIDPNMRELAAETGLPIILSHHPEAAAGNVAAGHELPKINSLEQVLDEVHASIDDAVAAGVEDENIIVDPGIGFGKSRSLNWDLLRFADYIEGYQVMIGYSRKRFLGENRKDPEVNFAVGQIAVDAGADFLRVHDVQSHLPLK